MTEDEKVNRYGPIVALVESRSENKTYEVRHRDGSFACQCRGWQFRKKCHHVDSLNGWTPPTVHVASGRHPARFQQAPVDRFALAVLGAARDAGLGSLTAPDVARLTSSLRAGLSAAGLYCDPAVAVAPPETHGIRRILLD
jgi:hypothetical protein